jgi:hypothetical protein
VISVAVAALAGDARAQDPTVDDEPFLGDPIGVDTDDYDSENSRWNGLTQLRAIAEGFRLRVDVFTRLDWEDLGSEDILFILYPINRVEPGHLAGFIRNGGHVMLADDFGDSGAAIARLGMLRQQPSGVSAARFYKDLPFAPIATPLSPQHPLATGVTELHTNHPAVLTEVKGPEVVFGFGDGEGVVAAGAIGDGRFIVCSDPSLFINRMLQFEGNLQLAINAIRFLNRDGEAKRLVILTGEYTIYGEPSGLLDDGTLRGKSMSMMSDFNRWLEERNDYFLTEIALKVIGVLVAMLIALMAIASLPLARRSKLDGGWTRAKSQSRVDDDFENVVSRYEEARPGASYILPAAVLRDSLNTALGRVVEVAEPLYTMQEPDLMRDIGDRCGAEASAALARVYRRVKGLPSRVQAASQWSKGYLSRRDFERLHHDVTELHRILGHRPPS